MTLVETYVTKCRTENELRVLAREMRSFVHHYEGKSDAARNKRSEAIDCRNAMRSSGLQYAHVLRDHDEEAMPCRSEPRYEVPMVESENAFWNDCKVAEGYIALQLECCILCERRLRSAIDLFPHVDAEADVEVGVESAMSEEVAMDEDMDEE
jgi:hypothetical protein